MVRYKTEKLKSVLRVSGGNFLEMYDFMVFGYFSAAIGRVYFPAGSEFAEIVPVAVRTAGFSLAYSLATTVGGATPLIVTYLFHSSGNRAIPGAWLSLAAAISLIGTIASRRAMQRAA